MSQQEVMNLKEVYEWHMALASTYRGPDKSNTNLQAAIAIRPFIRDLTADVVEIWMIRRNDGEVHWDETACVFPDEASASQEARLMTDNDQDGYSFGAFQLRSDNTAPLEYLPIDTAPIDGTMHVRGLYVYDGSGNPYWEAVAGYIDEEDGIFYTSDGDVAGWSAEDFTHWSPLPKTLPPEEKKS